MISDADIVAGFQWILGRTPRPDEISAYRCGFSSMGGEWMERFQQELFRSAEFRDRRHRVQQSQHCPNMELNRARVAFVHIEKCGGTTMHAMLASQFEPARICPERLDGLCNWTIHELAAYDLFSGHFDLALCGSIPGTVRTVTMLREPKSRLLSLFNFWKSHAQTPDTDKHALLTLARSLSAEHFFSDPFVIRHPSIRNAIAGQLTRTRNKALLAPEDPLMTDDPAVFDMAFAKLQALTGFGIMERFEDSRLVLNRSLGVQMPVIRPRQVLGELVVTTPGLIAIKPEPMSERLDRLLDELTGIDRRLYENARRLFEHRLAPQHPPATSAPMAGRTALVRRLVRLGR